MNLQPMRDWWAGTPTLYPFLLAVAPIVFLVANNIDQVAPGKAVVPLLWSLGATGIGVALLRRRLDRHHAAALAAIGVFLFWTYGHALDAFAVRIPALVGTNQWWFFAAWMFVAVALVVAVARRAVPAEVTKIANVIAAAFVAMSLLQGAWGLMAQDDAGLDAQDVAVTGNERPDIYHIILDGYGGPRHLQEVYGFDNSPFLEGLEARGFQVARNATSNYPMTFLSLASTLNLDYLDALDGRDGADRSVPYRMMQDNRMLRLLQGAGYEGVHLSSGWGGTDHNPFADRNIHCGRFDDFAMTLIQTTLLRPLQEPILGDDHRTRIDCTFDRIPDAAGAGPTYTFAHMVTPHNPYVFHADGSPRADDDLAFNWARWGEREPYIDQLAYVNQRVEEVVDRILASPDPPVIFLHADHGTAVRLAQDRDGKGAFEDRLPDDPTPEQLQERFDILLAVYVPPHVNATMPDDTTIVNAARWVLNQTVGFDLEPLPDKAYYSVYEAPFHFRDVTAEAIPSRP